MKLPKEIIFNMRFIRYENGFTQKQLAHALGVTRETINYVENGKREISMELFFKWLDFCGYYLDIKKK